MSSSVTGFLGSTGLDSGDGELAGLSDEELPALEPDVLVVLRVAAPGEQVAPRAHASGEVQAQASGWWLGMVPRPAGYLT